MDKPFQTDQNADDLDVQMFKMVKIGFSLEFRQIIVLAKVTKLLVGMLANLMYTFNTGSWPTLTWRTIDAPGLVCKDPCSEKD